MLTGLLILHWGSGMHTAAPAEDMHRFPHASDMPPRHIAFLFQETAQRRLGRPGAERTQALEQALVRVCRVPGVDAPAEGMSERAKKETVLTAS